MVSKMVFSVVPTDHPKSECSHCVIVYFCDECVAISFSLFKMNRPKKINCVFPLTCSGKNRVGRSVKYIYFFCNFFSFPFAED